MYEETFPLCIVEYDKQLIGVPAVYCWEVRFLKQWREIPLSPKFLYGVTEYKGRAIPLLDIFDILFAKPVRFKLKDKSIILVAGIDRERTAAFLMEKIPGIFPVPFESFHLEESKGVFPGHCSYKKHVITLVDFPVLIKQIRDKIISESVKYGVQK